MKLLNVLASFFRIFLIGHGTILIRMSVVFIIFEYFFADNFNLRNEITEVFSYFLIFYVIYGVTIALDARRMESSPLFLSGFIEKVIKEDFLLRNVLTSKDERGVFVPNTTVDGIEITTTFSLHHDQRLIHHRAKSFLYILYSMNLPSHEKTISWLEKLSEESMFMMESE